MHRDTNRQILEEINRLNSLKSGTVIGRNQSGKTTVTYLGKFHSEAVGRDLDIGLKEYSSKTEDVLNIQVATELGLIDLVEKNFPHLVGEFPLFHGVFLDENGKPIGVVTEDYSKNGTVPVRSVGWNRDVLPYEIQGLVDRPKDLDDLATTSFLVDGKRRIGDFGEFTFGDVEYKLKLAENYLDTMDAYSVRVALEGR
jgi:hypothetical protein